MSRFPITMLLIALPAFAASAQPRIVLSVQSYNFGHVENTASIEHRFEVRNQGDEPLQIGRLRACCGVSTEITATEIPAGSHAFLDVSLSLRRRQGKLERNIFIASNDPATPYAKIELTGTAVSTVSIEPRWINFPDAAGSAPHEASVTITSIPDWEFAITEARIDSSSFEYSHRQPTDTTHQLTIRTVPPLQPGTTRAVLRIETDREDYPTINIPLSATVDSAIVVVPPEILLAESEVGASRFVAIRCKRKQPFKILEIATADNGIAIQTVPEANGYRLEINNLIAHQDSEPQSIFITTDREDARHISVPIRIVTAAPERKQPE